MIVCDIAVIVILDVTGGMREAVPSGFAFAVFIPRAFDLIRRRC